MNTKSKELFDLKEVTNSIDRLMKNKGISNKVDRFLDIFQEWVENRSFNKVDESRNLRHQERIKLRVNAKNYHWGIVAKSILLFGALTGITLLGMHGFMKGEALVGLFAAYIGYLWGERKSI